MRRHPHAVAAVHGEPGVDLRRAERAREPDRAGAAGPGPAPGGRGRGGHRARPGLDGRGHRRLQGRRGVPARRAALPGRPDRHHAVAGGLQPGADRAGKHDTAGRGPRRPAGDPAAAGRRRRTPRTTPRTTSVCRWPRTRPRTSTSPPVPRARPRARCASTPGCSTICSRRSPTWPSARARWWRRSRRSASTSRCGSWSRALLVGGRTVLVPQEAILDVARFVDTLVAARGARAAGRAVVPRGRAVLPRAAPARAAGPALRVGHRRGAEDGAGAAVLRRPARQDARQRLRAHRDLGRHQPRGHARAPGPATACRWAAPVRT